jgi:hypothetical protein
LIYQILRVAAELDAWMTQERVDVGGLTVTCSSGSC